MVDINHVYNALDLMLGNDTAEIKRASDFLDEFQKTEHAWNVADQLLKEARSEGASIFAAQTIRRKLERDFRELPTASYLPLRDSLLNHLSDTEQRLGANYQKVSVHLCVALADLYLQVPEWNNFIAEILNKFAELSQKDVKYAHILLMLFKVFPEQLEHPSLRIGDNRRNAVQQELAAQTEPMIAYLEYVCQTYPVGEIQSQAIETLGSWMTIKQCPSEIVAKSSFLRSVLLALQTPNCPADVHTAAADAICKALTFCADLDQHLLLATTLKDGIINTMGAFEQAANTEDNDKLISYGKVYSDLCLMLLEPIINTPGEALGDLNALEMLLLAANHHDYAVVKYSFDTWYQLSEALYYLNEYEFDAKREIFKPFVERYIAMLYKHCRFDPDTERMPRETDDFVEFRQRASESIKDVAFVLGTLNLVDKMVEIIMESNRSWDEIESGFFIIKSAANCIVNTDESITPKLLELVLLVPSTSNAILMTTSVELLGELYDWLSERPTQLVQCVDWLLRVPLNAEILKPWALSLQKLTSKGHTSLRDYFERIYAILNAIQSYQGSSYNELEDAAEEIIKALTNLVNDRPAEEISNLLGILLEQPLEYLEKICSGQLQRLRRSNGNENEPGAAWQNFAANPVVWLDRITCIYRMLKPWTDQACYKHLCRAGQKPDIPAAWYEHSVKVWQRISAAFDRFKDDLRTMEHCCRTTRFLVRSMGPQSIVFIEELALKLVNIYSEHAHSCILYLCSIIVDEYGTNPALENGLVTMLNVLSQHAFAIFTRPDGPREHPETVDDLFRLAIRFCYRMPNAFFQQAVADHFLNAAVHTVELDHPDANKSVVQFLTEVLSIASSRREPQGRQTAIENAQQLILKYGQQLLWHCLHGSIFVLTSTLRFDVANLIKLLVQLDKAGSHGWLDACIAELPKDSGLSATTEQLMQFKERLWMRCYRTSDYCHEVSELSRLYT